MPVTGTTDEVDVEVRSVDVDDVSVDKGSVEVESGSDEVVDTMVPTEEQYPLRSGSPTCESASTQRQGARVRECRRTTRSRARCRGIGGVVGGEFGRDAASARVKVGHERGVAHARRVGCVVGRAGAPL